MRHGDSHKVMRSNTIGHSNCDGTQTSSLFVAKMASRVNAHKSQSGEYVTVYAITSIERDNQMIRFKQHTVTDPKSLQVQGTK